MASRHAVGVVSAHGHSIRCCSGSCSGSCPCPNGQSGHDGVDFTAGCSAHAPKSRRRQPPAAGARPPQLPPRTPFTAADEAAAVIPGMPDARFWADSDADFLKALPAQPGPWLALSSGGSDGAFGAGLLSGWTASGNRPDFSVVTGVSTGALMSPFVFAGTRYDDQLRDAYTKVTASDIFEVGSTGESFVDTWPLKELIEKQITPALMADIAGPASRRPPSVRDHDRPRCRSLRGLEHGRNRSARRRQRAQTCFATSCWPQAASPARFLRC